MAERYTTVGPPKVITNCKNEMGTHHVKSVLEGLLNTRITVLNTAGICECWEHNR